MEIGDGMCESPIEEMFLLSFLSRAGDLEQECVLVKETDEYFILDNNTIAVMPQFPIWPYRVDFMLCWKPPDKEIDFLIVECDGQEFHSSANNSEKDAFRDRELRKVANVVRFPGPRLWKHSRDCASEVLRLMGKCDAKQDN